MDKVDQTNQKALGKLYFFLLVIIFYYFFINNIKINFIHNILLFILLSDATISEQQCGFMF